MLTATHHLLVPDPPHYAWDNSLRPRLTIASGDTVTFETRDASDGHFRLDSTSADVASYEFRGHPLTGPVYVEGARAGDVLLVEVLEVRPASFGWTAIVPDFGLLPEDFSSVYLRTWDLSDGAYARLGDRFRQNAQKALLGKQYRQSSVSNHEPQPLFGVKRIQRHIAAASLEHAQQAD